jgi:hypothetical protein
VGVRRGVRIRGMAVWVAFGWDLGGCLGVVAVEVAGRVIWDLRRLRFRHSEQLEFSSDSTSVQVIEILVAGI